MGLVRDVAQHEQQIFKGKQPHTIYCRRCRAKDDFKRHDVRRRSFTGTDGGEVVTIRSWIARWICKNCCYRFTDQPPFGLPRKQSTKQVVFELTRRILDEPLEFLTYRATACIYAHQSVPLPISGICSHSTLWRWMTWLYELRDEASRAMEHIQTDDPGSMHHRNLWLIRPKKYGRRS